VFKTMLRAEKKCTAEVVHADFAADSVAVAV
jgi:hypothetical protein